MNRIATSALIMLALAPLLSAAERPAPGEQTLPASDINRESNNPAKAAIKAREAQDKDKAKLEGMVGEVTAADAQLVRNVEAALRNDTRTQKLVVTVKLDEDKQVSLHGSVPSAPDSSAAITVATKVAGADRVKSYLVIAEK